jgi:hypothetical protein
MAHEMRERSPMEWAIYGCWQVITGQLSNIMDHLMMNPLGTTNKLGYDHHKDKMTKTHHKVIPQRHKEISYI